MVGPYPSKVKMPVQFGYAAPSRCGEEVNTSGFHPDIRGFDSRQRDQLNLKR